MGGVQKVEAVKNLIGVCSCERESVCISQAVRGKDMMWHPLWQTDRLKQCLM